MAKFGEKTFSFTEVQKFYRIPISSSGDQCFLNVGKNSVAKIHNQKALHTWTLTHPNDFTSPVVYFDETLYCVMNNNILIKWCVNEDNLKNAEKIKFQDSVFAVIPVIGEQPLVLFRSGKYAVIDGSDISNLKPIGLECLKKNEELIWAGTSAVASDIKLFCFASNEKNKSYTVYSFIVKKNEKTSIDLHSHIISHQTTDLKNWCLNNHDTSFISVWSGGIVRSHKDSKDTDILFLKDTKSNMNIAITCIDSNHIAVAMAGKNEKDNCWECILNIWDIKFSVLKTQKVLKASALDNLQISADNSSIFLCLNKEVISIPFHVECSKITAAIGKSIPDTDKTKFYWEDNGQLQIPPSNEPEAMDVSESKQKLDSIEIIAQRLLNQNSKNLMYIPESELTNLLQLAVKHSKEENASLRNAACVTLNFVFSATFRDNILVNYLKRMNLKDILVALELLLSFLNSTIEMPADVVQKPSDFQIVNWTCLIIQSHMEALLFSRDKKSRKLLRKLEKALCVKMDEYDDYEDIQHYFTILQKKNMLPEKSSVGKYSIETLDV